jgi:hypothetical protein
MACKAETEDTPAAVEARADMMKVGTRPAEVSALEEGGHISDKVLSDFCFPMNMRRKNMVRSRACVFSRNC